MTDRGQSITKRTRVIFWKREGNGGATYNACKGGMECRFGEEGGSGVQHSTQGSATDFCGQVGPGIGQLACGQPLYPQRCVGRASPATVLTPSPTYSASTAGRRVHGCPPADPALRDPVLRVPPYTPDYLLSLPAPSGHASHEIRRIVLTIIDRGASSVLGSYIYSLELNSREYSYFCVSVLCPIDWCRFHWNVNNNYTYLLSYCNWLFHWFTMLELLIIIYCFSVFHFI